MLRHSARLCGSFLLNQRLLADWWQPRYRERVHEAAKEQLNQALQHRHDDGLHHSPRGVVDGDGRVDEQEASLQGGDLPAVSSSALLDLREANALVATFVSCHNTEDLSAVLQYIRERLGEDLAPFHFHALLRSFNFHQDRHNALQLLEVMAQAGTMTHETYARMVDCVHVLAPTDVEERILRLVALAQEAFGGLVMHDGPGSEGGVTAQYSGSEEGRAARQAMAAPPELASVRSAPVLSSLLHHLSTTHNADTTVACFLVALWIRALGVELGDWDTFMVLMSLLAHPDSFPRVRTLFGHYEGFERGHVSVQAVLDRLVLLRETTVEQSPIDGTMKKEKRRSGQQRQDGGEQRHSSGDASRPPNAASSPLLSTLVAAMRRSLLEAGGERLLTAPVSLAFMNAQTNDMEEVLVRTLHPLFRSGVGPHRYNAGHLLHALSLMHSTVSDDASALRLLLRGIREQDAIGREQEAVSATAAATSSVYAPAPDGLVAEPFAVPVHYLIDMGTLLNRMTASTLQEMQRPFRAAIRRLVGSLSDASSSFGAADAEAAMAPTCSPPQPTARDLVQLSNYETQFIRTLAEARAALRDAMDSANAAGGQGRLPSSTQLMLYQLAEFCCRHPPRNPKLTPAGLEERAKWARYLDARDTSLALFGSARQSRDSMKHLFYHDNRMPALRSDAVIARDFADVHRIFFGHAIPQPSTPVATQAELQEALRRTRTTLPHTGSAEAAVPRYLWDAAVFNPYPAAQLANNSFDSPRSSDGGAAGAFSAAEVHQVESALGEDAEELTDASTFFVELWQALMDRSTAVGRNDAWYLQNTSMYLLLVRCLLHRLDWEAAVHLTRKMTQHAHYTYMMDHELTTIFREIGDPAGCLAFKVATKLFDGRITKDNQAKKEQF